MAILGISQISELQFLNFVNSLFIIEQDFYFLRFFELKEIKESMRKLEARANEVLQELESLPPDSVEGEYVHLLYIMVLFFLFFFTLI